MRSLSPSDHPDKTTRKTFRGRGQTLVELMTVISVMAIVGAIVVPALSGTNGSKLRSAAAILAADLDAARSECIAHGEDTRLMVFDTTNNTYHLAAASDPATPLTDPVSGLPYRIDYGAGSAKQLNRVTIQSVSLGGDNELGFGLYGQLDQATDATITLESEGTTITLTLDAESGEVTIGDLQ